MAFVCEVLILTSRGDDVIISLLPQIFESAAWSPLRAPLSAISDLRSTLLCSLLAVPCLLFLAFVLLELCVTF